MGWVAHKTTVDGTIQLFEPCTFQYRSTVYIWVFQVFFRTIVYSTVTMCSITGVSLLEGLCYLCVPSGALLQARYHMVEDAFLGGLGVFDGPSENATHDRAD